MKLAHDAALVCVPAGASAAAGLAYAVHRARRGPARSPRVERIGGSPLLGAGVMTWAYWALDPIVGALARRRVSPDALTWGSLALGLGAGVALGAGWFGLGCLLATCSTLGDVLDGQVARATGRGRARGELLDAAVDRYTELAFLGGLIVFLRDSAALVVLALAALQACVMISYASAKAEALQVAPPRGLMRRHERAAYLIAGAAAASLAGDPWPELVALAVVAAVGNAAAIVRLVRIGRALGDLG